MNLNIEKTDKCPTIQTNCYCDDENIQIIAANDLTNTDPDKCCFNITFIKKIGACTVNTVLIDGVPHNLTLTDNDPESSINLCINKSFLSSPVNFEFTFANNKTCSQQKQLQCTCDCITIEPGFDAVPLCTPWFKVCVDPNCSTLVSLVKSQIKEAKISYQGKTSFEQVVFSTGSDCSNKISLSINEKEDPLLVNIELFNESGAALCPLSTSIANTCDCCPDINLHCIITEVWIEDPINVGLEKVNYYQWCYNGDYDKCKFYGIQINADPVPVPGLIKSITATNIPLNQQTFCTSSFWLPAQCPQPQHLTLIFLDKNGEPLCTPVIKDVSNCQIIHSSPKINGDYKDKQYEIIQNNDLILNYFNIFPNPTNNSTELQFNANAAGDCQIVIIDCLGAVLKDMKISYINKGGNKLKIDLSDVNSGIYYLQIRTRTQSKVLPISIIR
ncbi:MAG: T9SS type A sorting domain-containing protein [Candidatus Kapabacteria bacterium]|nr:T9SS type A sorting domain-containing protein [Candidatus Kapabacteria bacterium]